MPEAPFVPRIACHGVGEPRCDQGSSWDNKVTAKALEVRLDLLGGRDQVAKARTRPSGWEGSAFSCAWLPGQSLRTGAWLVAQVGRVNAQGLVMMS